MGPQFLSPQERIPGAGLSMPGEAESCGPTPAQESYGLSTRGRGGRCWGQAPLRDVIARSQAVFDPMHKLLNLAVRLSLLHSNMGGCPQTMGSHL